MRRYLPLIVLALVLGLVAAGISSFLADDSTGVREYPTPTGTTAPEEE